MNNYYSSNPRFYVGIDCIIFGFLEGELSLLLLQRDFEPARGEWSLMGGFVQEDESVDDAAKRVLAELTGLDKVYMEQVGAFGDVQRDPGGRVVSVAYYALIKIEDYDRYCVDFFGDPIGIGMIPSLWLTIFAQIPCAIALILGLFSRPAATVLAINMAVAVKYHWNDPLATVSLPIVFLAMYVLLMLTGGGRFSLDSLIFKQKTGRRHRR